MDDQLIAVQVHEGTGWLIREVYRLAKVAIPLSRIEVDGVVMFDEDGYLERVGVNIAHLFEQKGVSNIDPYTIACFIWITMKAQPWSITFDDLPICDNRE